MITTRGAIGIIILALSICTLAAGETPSLPPVVQKELDILAIGIARADAERQVKVNRLVDQCIKALNAQVKTASSAQERRAIDDEILRIEKLRSDPAGDLAVKPGFIGKLYDGDKFWGEIKPDGTATHAQGWTGSWVLKDGKLVITWSGNSYSDTLDPPDEKGVIKGTNNRGGTWTMKVITKKEK